MKKPIFSGRVCYFYAEKIEAAKVVSGERAYSSVSLEHTPDKREGSGAIPLRPMRGCSSAGRTSGLHPEGQGFKSPHLHGNFLSEFKNIFP